MPKRSTRLILDLDGVVANFDRSARSLLKEHRGVDVPPSKGWDHIESFCSDEDWVWLWTSGIDFGLFRHPDRGGRCFPHTGAQKGVQDLCGLVDVAFVTARPPAAIPDTYEWLGRYGFSVPELRVVHDQRKSDVIPQGDIYVDDAPHVIEDLRKNTYGAVICFARPWNADVVPDSRLDVHRIKDWPSIVEFIRQRVTK